MKRSTNFRGVQVVDDVIKAARKKESLPKGQNGPPAPCAHLITPHAHAQSLHTQSESCTFWASGYSPKDEEGVHATVSVATDKHKPSLDNVRTLPRAFPRASYKGE